MLSYLEKILNETVNSSISETEAENVTVSVNDMRVQTPDNHNDILPIRGKPDILRKIVMNTTGRKRNYDVPCERDEEILEVESPPGTPLSSGNDYFIDDDKIRFYERPLKADLGLLVIVKGPDTEGYKEKRPCKVTINLVIDTALQETADQLFSRVLNLIMVKLAGMINIHPDEPSDIVTKRILNSVSVLESVTRKAVEKNNSSSYQIKAEIKLLGDFEIIVAVRPAEEGTYISEIKGDIEIIPQP